MCHICHDCHISVLSRSRTLGPTHSTLTIEHILSTHLQPQVTATATLKSTQDTTPTPAAPVIVAAVKVGDSTTTTPTKGVSTNTPSTVPAAAALNYVSLTLPAAELESLQASLHIPTTFATSLLRSFATEAAVPLHSQVLLRPLGGKLFGFSLRVFARLEAHLAYTLGVSTTACPMDAHTSSGADTQTQPPLSNSGTTVDNTPLKRVGSVAVVPTPNTPAVTAAVSTHTYDVDDLMTTTRDLCRLIGWLQTEYKHMAHQQLVLSLSGQQTAAVESAESSSLSAGAVVDECVSVQTRRVADLRAALWRKICGVLANVCFMLIAIIF